MKKKDKIALKSQLNRNLKVLLGLFLLSWLSTTTIYLSGKSALFLINIAILSVGFIVSILFYLNIYRLYLINLSIHTVTILGALFISLIFFVLIMPLLIAIVA